MYTIQIGTLLLNGQILLNVAFGGLGWTALRFYVRNRPSIPEMVPIMSNAFLIWFLVWKLSYILFDPVGIFKHPLSILYFDGGVRGRWLAAFIAVGYTAYQARKRNLSSLGVAEAATVFLLGGTIFYHMGLTWFERDIWAFHGAVAGLALVILVTLLVPKKKLDWAGLLQRWQWYCFGIVGVWYANPERTLFFLSLHFQQAVYMFVGIALSTALWSMQREQT